MALSRKKATTIALDPEDDRLLSRAARERGARGRNSSGSILPWCSGTALFVGKVSSLFQVVAAASDAADLLDCAGLNPRQRREYFRNERYYILHAIGQSAHDHDPERKNRNILLVLQVSIDRHEGID